MEISGTVSYEKHRIQEARNGSRYCWVSVSDRFDNRYSLYDWQSPDETAEFLDNIERGMVIFVSADILGGGYYSVKEITDALPS